MFTLESEQLFWGLYANQDSASLPKAVSPSVSKTTRSALASLGVLREGE